MGDLQMSAADEQHLEVMLFQDMRYQSGPLVLVHLLQPHQEWRQWEGGCEETTE